VETGIESGTANNWIYNSTGTLTVDHSEFENDGGQTGPRHDIYLGVAGPAGRVDTFTNNWFHGTYYGHQIKDRGNNIIARGNLFEGDELAPLSNYGNSSLIESTCGGGLIVEDNILIKGATVSSASGSMVRYFAEGGVCLLSGGYPDTSYVLNKPIRINNNTWFSNSKTVDGSPTGNPIGPFYSWGYPYNGIPSSPGDSKFPSNNFEMKNNVFAGFCPNSTAFDGSGVHTYNFPWNEMNPALPVGPNLNVAPSELNEKYELTTNYYSGGDDSVIGKDSYGHQATSGGARTASTMGAKDFTGTGTSIPTAVPHVTIVSSFNYKPSGGLVRLSWTDTGGATCVGVGGPAGWAGSKARNSFQDLTPPANAQTTYRIDCTDASGLHTGTSSVDVQAIDPPVLTMITSSSVTSPGAGQEVPLDWSSINSDTCQIGWGTALTANAQGPVTVTPSQTIRFGVSCQGVNGSSPEQFVDVTVPGTTEFPTSKWAGSPVFVQTSTGHTATITWDTHGATSCTATNWDENGNNAGSHVLSATSGTTLPFAPISTGTNYFLQCTGPGGTTTNKSISFVVS
jgi:hypothetical protein